MSLRVRFQYTTGASLGYSIERLADGLFFDFSTSTFTTTPSTLIAALPEDSGNYQGRYKLTLATTPSAQFTNGSYAITIHNTGAGNLVVGELSAIMFGGDDAPVVVVGANNDKSGYALASNGLDSIQVESGINARQEALSHPWRPPRASCWARGLGPSSSRARTSRPPGSPRRRTTPAIDQP